MGTLDTMGESEPGAPLGNVEAGLYDVADATRQVAHTVQVTKRWLILAAAAIAVGALAVGVFGLLLLQGQAQGRGILKGVQGTQAYIEGCQTPPTPGHPHPCYDVVAANTKGILTRSNYEIVFAAECARQPDLTDPQIETCIKAKLTAVGQSAFP